MSQILYEWRKVVRKKYLQAKKKKMAEGWEEHPLVFRVRLLQMPVSSARGLDSTNGFHAFISLISSWPRSQRPFETFSPSANTHTLKNSLAASFLRNNVQEN